MGKVPQTLVADGWARAGPSADSAGEVGYEWHVAWCATILFRPGDGEETSHSLGHRLLASSGLVGSACGASDGDLVGHWELRA